MCLLVVEAHGAATDETQPVVSEEVRVEGFKDDVREGEGDHLEDEETHDDGGRVEAGLRSTVHDVLAQGGVHHPVPTRQHDEDGSEDGSDQRQAPEHLFFGFQRAEDVEVERGEVRQQEDGG